MADRKPSSTVKWITGVLMYLVMLGFVVAMVVLVRRTRVAAPGRSLMTE